MDPLTLNEITSYNSEKQGIDGHITFHIASLEDCTL
jgi:hypothetical protein